LPNALENGEFIFGTMLNLTTSPPTRSASMIRCRVFAYLAPDADNRIHDFIAPP
jgi:hypothetical protein